MLSTTQHRKYRLFFALLAVFSLLAAACSSGGDDETTADPTPADAATTTEQQDDDETVDADGAEEPAEVPLDLGPGVTDDTITLGYTYLDFDAVRERGLIDLNWGPMDEHAQVLVDHINANGGIGGRSIELLTRALDPVDPASAQTACLELTEDNEVFAVLGTLRRDEVLCYTEQHETIAIANADMTQERIDRANAPYAVVSATRERSSAAFVEEAIAQGLFEGKTVAVLSIDAHDAANDVVIPGLTAVGVDVELDVLIQGDGSVGGAAAELTPNIESMRSRNIDTVVIVGDTNIPVNTFIGEGYFPTLFITDQGAAQTTAGRADMTLFPAVYTFGGPTAGSPASFEEPLMQEECIAPWNELNPDRAAIIPSAVPAGEPSHGVGLRVACRVLVLFSAIAEAAGPNLNNETFGAALEELGEVAVPGTGVGTVGNGKYDALDDLRLWTLNPNAEDDGQDFIEFGS